MANVAAQQHDQRDVVTRLSKLNAAYLDPRHETPVFAAGLEFARETAGPIATAFLDALPYEWTTGHLVFDSTIVWLPVGFRQGPMFWCHEPFPGRTDGVTGQSNLQRTAEHIACCCGPTGIEFLADEAAEAELAQESLPMTMIHERHARLQSEIDAGRLSILIVPPDTLYHYRWGAFHRHQVAACSGFQFWIRATRGDHRPLVNGIRNATNL